MHMPFAAPAGASSPSRHPAAPLPVGQARPLQPLERPLEQGARFANGQCVSVPGMHAAQPRLTARVTAVYRMRGARGTYDVWYLLYGAGLREAGMLVREQHLQAVQPVVQEAAP